MRRFTIEETGNFFCVLLIHKAIELNCGAGQLLPS